MNGYRMIECPYCDGARGYETITGYDPRDGQPTGFWTECPACKGKGEIWIETQPITLEDLDA